MFEKITTLFHQGGEAVMSSIAFVLLISIVIIIERAFRYWFQYDLPNSDGYMSAVQKMVMNNSIENAIRLCKKAKPKLLPYVLSEALKRAQRLDAGDRKRYGACLLERVAKGDERCSISQHNRQRRDAAGTTGHDLRFDEIVRCRGICNGGAEADHSCRRYCRSFDRNLVRTGHSTVMPASLRGIDDEADCNRQRHQQKLSPFARSFVYSQTKTEQLAI